MVDESKQLLADSVNFGAVNGATTSGQYVLLSGKGPVVNVSVVAGTDTIADAAASFLTVSYNNTQVLKDVPLSLFMRQTVDVRKFFKTSMWAQQSVIDYSVRNASGNDIPVSIIFYYSPVDENDPVQVADFNAQQKQWTPPTVN